ncbi:MAG TPA: decaprenyl-phosphate phosphoribosyltransferase [Prevotella sp.]
MKEILRLIRPHQWIKNFFVLLPLFFSGQLLHGASLFHALVAFLAFSFAASSVYCFNDIYDVEDDRRHPVKCHRPIAAGTVSISQGYLLMGLMIVLSMLSTLLLSERAWQTAGIILCYYLLNLGYCAKLKQYAIIDVCIVAFGFVLRILGGGLSTGVGLSKWIVLMTFLLTLFLGFAKRRDDVVRMNATGMPPRRNTVRYNLTFINQAVTITAAVTLVCYIMYTVSPEVVSNFHTDYLYLTTAFVLLGLLRYMQLASVDQKSGDPTKVLLKDRFTQLTVLLWGLSFFIIIYFI